MQGFLLQLADRLRPLRGEHRQLGRVGERAAERYLRQRGYRTLGRNLRGRHGELDLLVQDPAGTLVVIEVKASRRGGAVGHRPEARVGPAKQRQIAALATRLARRHRLTQRPWRFDVVGVELPAPGDPTPPTIRHHVAAFDAGF